MSINTSAVLQCTLSWSQSDSETNDVNNTLTDEGYYVYNRTLSSGTGYAQINQLWHETRSLTSGGSYPYNMTALPRSVFSGTFNQSFSNVRGIYIENKSFGSGIIPTGIGSGGITGYFSNTIMVSATGANGFSGVFNGQAGNYHIPAKSPFMLINYVSGWPVTSVNNTLFIRDMGSHSGGPVYRIGIVGLS